MSEIAYPYYEDDRSGLLTHLVGQSVTAADLDGGTLTLSDGTVVTFDKTNHDCCSSIELTALNVTGNVITAASFGDNEDKTGGDGAYKAWLHVVTEAGELNIAEADGDASNGYYLHGFALDVTVTLPGGATS